MAALAMIAPRHTTQLNFLDELEYRKWMKSIGHTKDAGYAVDENGNGINYDYRGFFQKYGPKAIGQGDHFTDEFKLPTHETFSVESQYANGAAKALAGRWDGDTYIKAGK